MLTLNENNAITLALLSLFFLNQCTAQVHQGFCDYFDYLNQAGFSDALAALAAAHPTYPVVLTGHSLGAAVAVVAATYLGQSTHALATTVYTYGQPRVGDFSFSQLFSESVQVRPQMQRLSTFLCS